MGGDGGRASDRLAIVADDLTGAADAAAPFAALGVPAAVALRPGFDPGTPVVAVSTESRDLPEAEAAAAVRAAALWLAEKICPRWWYKKIDSMWRGWPVAESQALAEAIGVSTVVLAPALPARGRAVRDGVIAVGPDELVDPQARTSTPLRLLTLAEVRSGPVALTELLRSSTGTAVLADGESEADLRALAAASLAADGVLPAGSAGLAAHLATALPLPRSPRPQRPATVPTLAVVASRHPVAADQIAAVEAAGAAVVVRAPTDGGLEAPAVRARLAAKVAGELAGGRSTILTTAGDAASTTSGRVLAQWLAGVAAHSDVLGHAAAFYLSGGDAAATCLEAMAAGALLLGGEVEPGIPWGYIGGGSAAGAPLVTKAGSFGDPDTLLRCLAFLAGVDGVRD